MKTAQGNSRYICLNCRQQQHGDCIGDECDCVCKELRANMPKHDFTGLSSVSGPHAGAAGRQSLARTS
jgi:hypothetical protein